MRPSPINLNATRTQCEIEVTLDGLRVDLPPQRRTLNAIRSYLETMAMKHQRIVCSFIVDGRRTNLDQPLFNAKKFSKVEAESIDLDQMPLQLIKTALQQTAQARQAVLSAAVQVLINDGVMARECWWNLTKDLKAPLLTLSLLPETICGPANGRASLLQLRKWQLQQLASVIETVDDACWSEDTSVLSNALENCAVPWLDKLEESLDLWHKTLLAGNRELCEIV